MFENGLEAKKGNLGAKETTCQRGVRGIRKKKPQHQTHHHSLRRDQKELLTGLGKKGTAQLEERMRRRYSANTRRSP